MRECPMYRNGKCYNPREHGADTLTHDCSYAGYQVSYQNCMVYRINAAVYFASDEARRRGDRP